MKEASVDGDRGRSELEPLRSDPPASAVLCDLDGTLAPIVPRPEDVAVPGETRSVLRSLAGRYGLVAVVTGRRAVDARRIVGVDELTVAGNHGFELLEPGGTEPILDPRLDGHQDDARRFAAGLDRAELDRLGIRSEEKGPIIALHWRGSPRPDEAEARAGEIASAAESCGLAPHRGRRVLEIRPGLPIDKGVAVKALIRDRGSSIALFGGDDRTDADAFAALARLRETGELVAAVRVAVSSAEMAPEVAAEADFQVDGTDGFLEVLRALAEI